MSRFKMIYTTRLQYRLHLLSTDFEKTGSQAKKKE